MTANNAVAFSRPIFIRRPFPAPGGPVTRMSGPFSLIIKCAIIDSRVGQINGEFLLTNDFGRYVLAAQNQYVPPRFSFFALRARPRQTFLCFAFCFFFYFVILFLFCSKPNPVFSAIKIIRTMDFLCPIMCWNTVRFFSSVVMLLIFFFIRWIYVVYLFVILRKYFRLY